jgi:hypothetical protein
VPWNQPCQTRNLCLHTPPGHKIQVRWKTIFNRSNRTHKNITCMKDHYRLHGTILASWEQEHSCTESMITSSNLNLLKTNIDCMVLYLHHESRNILAWRAWSLHPISTFWSFFNYYCYYYHYLFIILVSIIGGNLLRKMTLSSQHLCGCQETSIQLLLSHYKLWSIYLLGTYGWIRKNNFEAFMS